MALIIENCTLGWTEPIGIEDFEGRVDMSGCEVRVVHAGKPREVTEEDLELLRAWQYSVEQE